MTHPIFVTGPQRAGSRLASRIIARQTNRIHVGEFEYNKDIELNSVIQAPFLLKSVVELSYMWPTAQFAFMYRNRDDIIKSLERVEWYKDYIDHPDFYKQHVDHCYNFIKLLKTTLPKDRWFDIEYESFEDDPMFVKDRTDFTTMQYQAGKPIGPKVWRNDEYITTLKG